MNAVQIFHGIRKCVSSIHSRIHEKAQPRYEALKLEHGTKFLDLDSEQLEAVNIHIKALLEPDILVIPKNELKYSLDTDENNYQVGCALFKPKQT
eukprot:IDg21952t1